MGVQTNEQLCGLPKRFKRKFLVYFLSIFFLFFCFFFVCFFVVVTFFPFNYYASKKSTIPYNVVN